MTIAWVPKLAASAPTCLSVPGPKMMRFIDAAKAKGARAVYLSTFRTPQWNAPFYRKLGFVDVARADYLPWMSAIENQQAKFLDVNTRVFMRLGCRAP